MQVGKSFLLSSLNYFGNNAFSQLWAYFRLVSEKSRQVYLSQKEAQRYTIENLDPSQLIYLNRREKRNLKPPKRNK